MRENLAVVVGSDGAVSGGDVGTGWARPRGPKRRPLAERFRAKVRESGPTMPGMESPCWTWAGWHNRDGYGMITLGGHCGGNVAAARVALELSLGRPLREGEETCHRCDNPGCVRGDHLFAGTHSDNMKDCAAKGRLALSRFAPKNRGEENGRARLTQAKADEIRARYATETAAQLAEAFGVSVHTINAVVQNRTWRAA